MPKALIVHDKFHLIGYLSKAIDQVRLRKVKHHDLLKNSRYVLLKNEENLSEKQRDTYEQIKQSNIEVAKVWHLRENLKVLFNWHHDDALALEQFKAWAENALMSNTKQKRCRK